MKNYYITENNEKIEIIDKEEINLSGYKIATNKKIKEIYISDLPNCKTLFLQYNCLTKFKADLHKIEYLDLRYNNLTSFNATNCKTLNLRGNSLTTFNADLPNIEYLSLRNNNLSYKRLNDNVIFYI